MDYLWNDSDERGFYSSAEEDEMDADTRTADERAQEAADLLEADINRSMGDR